MMLVRQVRAGGAIALAAMLATACARLGAGPTSAPSQSTPSEATNQTSPPEGPPILAFGAESDTSSWVVTDHALLVTTDGGGSWTTVAAANVAGVRSILVLDAQHVVLGAINELDVVVRSTADGGKTWQESHLAMQGQPGDVRLAARDGVVAAIVQQTTSANFSQADLFVSVQGGTFSSRSVPAAGTVSITGPTEMWLAGGVLDNRLWRSSDAGLTWKEVQLPQQLGTDLSLSAPERVAGRLVLPVTLNGPVTQESLLASGDAGDSWQQLVVETIGGGTGPGVALPASSANDRIVVSGPTGGLYGMTTTGQALTPISPNGLPPGVTDLQFTSSTGAWALATQRGCAAGKSQCFSVTQLFSTQDSGQTWKLTQPPA